MRQSRGTCIGAVLIVVGAAAACKTNNISETNNTNNYATVIGPSGGTLLGPDGTKLFVPPGAVASDTKFSIRVADASEYPPLAAEVLASKVYAFEPRGAQLLTKVQISLPFRSGTTPSPFELATYGFAGPSAVRQGASVQVADKVTIAQDALGIFVVGNSDCPTDAPAPTTATIQVSGGLPQGAPPPAGDGYFWVYGDCSGPATGAPSQIAFELTSYAGACGIGSVSPLMNGTPNWTSGVSSGSRLIFNVETCQTGPIQTGQQLVSNSTGSMGPVVQAELFVANGSCSTSPAVLSGGGSSPTASITFSTLAPDHIAGTFTMNQSGKPAISGSFDLQPCGVLGMGQQSCCN